MVIWLEETSQSKKKVGSSTEVTVHPLCTANKPTSSVITILAPLSWVENKICPPSLKLIIKFDLYDSKGVPTLISGSQEKETVVGSKSLLDLVNVPAYVY